MLNKMLNKIIPLILMLIIIVLLCSCVDSQSDLTIANSNEVLQQKAIEKESTPIEAITNKNSEVLQNFQNDPDIDKVKTLTKEDKVFMNVLKDSFLEIGNEDSVAIDQIIGLAEKVSKEGKLTQREFYSVIGFIINILNTSDKTHETVDNTVLSNFDIAIYELRENGATNEEISYFESLKTLYLEGKENTYTEFEDPQVAIDKYLQSAEYTKIDIVNYAGDDIVPYIYNEEGVGYLCVSSRKVEGKLYYSITTSVISCEFSKIDTEHIINQTYESSSNSITYGLADSLNNSEITSDMNISEIQVAGKKYFFFYQKSELTEN